MIELPEFMNARVIERTYKRMIELQDRGREPWWNGGRRARHYREKGVRMAMARDARMLLFLEKSAEYLRARNDEQKSRIEQEGYQKTDFTEYSTLKLAYEKATEPRRDEQFMHATLGWVYAAVAEALDNG